MAAKKRRRRAPKGPDRPGPLASGTALVVLRLWTAGFFLVTAWWKLVEPGFSIGEKIAAFRAREYVPVLERAIAHPPRVLGVELGLFADFLESVMLPIAGVAAPALLLFELLLGITLLLGFGVRLFASLGFGMMLAFSLAKAQDPRAVEAPVGVFLFTVRHANWPVTGILLALALLAAGRVLGLDAVVRRRGPPWLRWTA